MRRMFGFMIGIFVGGLVGATLALLMAPSSGERLRDELHAARRVGHPLAHCVVCGDHPRSRVAGGRSASPPRHHSAIVHMAARCSKSLARLSECASRALSLPS